MQAGAYRAVLEHGAAFAFELHMHARMQLVTCQNTARACLHAATFCAWFVAWSHQHSRPLRYVMVLVQRAGWGSA